MEIRPKSKKTILLLDDEDVDRRTASQILQGEDYIVLEADSFKSALSLMDSDGPVIDMLIADISLPDGNGCELAVAARERKADLRVLFISGHVGSQVCRFYGLEVTDLHFLRKPFEAHELTQAIDRVFQSTERFPNLIPRTRTA